MKDYQIFNVFGMLTLRREHVSAIAAAANPVTHLSTEHTVNRDLPQPVTELAESEDSVMLFSAMVEDGEKPEIAVMQFTRRLGGPDLLNHPVVQETLRELVKKF